MKNNKLIKDNFSSVTCDLLDAFYLKEGEICVKDIQTKQLYARSYKYVKFGCCEIYDRELPFSLNQ